MLAVNINCTRVADTFRSNSTVVVKYISILGFDQSKLNVIINVYYNSNYSQYDEL